MTGSEAPEDAAEAGAPVGGGDPVGDGPSNHAVTEVRWIDIAVPPDLASYAVVRRMTLWGAVAKVGIATVPAIVFGGPTAWVLWALALLLATIEVAWKSRPRAETAWRRDPPHHVRVAREGERVVLEVDSGGRRVVSQVFARTRADRWWIDGGLDTTSPSSVWEFCVHLVGPDALCSLGVVLGAAEGARVTSALREILGSDPADHRVADTDAALASLWSPRSGRPTASDPDARSPR